MLLSLFTGRPSKSKVSREQVDIVGMPTPQSPRPPPLALTLRLLRYLHLFVMSLLYMSQGVVSGLQLNAPLLILHVDPATSMTRLGLLTFASYVSTVKFMWAPIVDSVYWAGWGGRRHSFSIFRRVQWVVAMQIAMVACFGFMIGISQVAGAGGGGGGGGAGTITDRTASSAAASCDVSSQVGCLDQAGGIEADLSSSRGKGLFSQVGVPTLLPILFLLAFLSSTQDIAVDAWAVEGVNHENDPAVTALAGSTQLLGGIIGASLMTWATERVIMHSTLAPSTSSSSSAGGDGNGGTTVWWTPDAVLYVGVVVAAAGGIMAVLLARLQVVLLPAAVKEPQDVRLGGQEVVVRQEDHYDDGSDPKNHLASGASGQPAPGIAPKVSASSTWRRVRNVYQCLPRLLRSPSAQAVVALFLCVNVVFAPAQMLQLKFVKSGIDKAGIARLALVSSVLSTVSSVVLAPMMLKRFPAVSFHRFATSLDYLVMAYAGVMYVSLLCGHVSPAGVLYYYMWPMAIYRSLLGGSRFIAVATWVGQEGLKPQWRDMSATVITLLNAMANAGFVIPSSLLVLTVDYVETFLQWPAVERGLLASGLFSPTVRWWQDGGVWVVPLALLIGAALRRRFVLPAYQTLESQRT